MNPQRRTMAVAVGAAAASLGVVVLILWWLGHAIGPPNRGVLDPGAALPHVDPYCGHLPAVGFDRPPNHAHAGAYLNPIYGYAVTIPAGLTGFSSSSGPQKGFGIVLSWSPRAFLRVDAIYDVFYDITAANVHLRDVVGVRLFDRLLADAGQPYVLAGTAGGRYQMRVQCGNDPQIYVHDDVIVVRNREIYRVDLQTVPQRHAADARRLEQLLRSWRWVPLAPAPVAARTTSSGSPLRP